ncbi:hypothetical protein GCM10009835_47680 [Planosporangium flavigriseum]
MTTTGSSEPPEAFATSAVMPAPGSGPECTIAQPDTHVRRMSGQCRRLSCTEKVTLREDVPAVVRRRAYRKFAGRPRQRTLWTIRVSLARRNP